MRISDWSSDVCASDLIGQAGRPHLGVIELRDATGATPHRPGDVHQHREVGVRVGLVLLYVITVGSRIQAPVDAADIRLAELRVGKERVRTFSSLGPTYNIKNKNHI